MTHTHTYATVHPSTKDLVELVEVVRKPTQTEAYFISEGGHYKVFTANGPIDVTAPVWILWDTGGDPYPVTVEEFKRIYEVK